MSLKAFSTVISDKRTQYLSFSHELNGDSNQDAKRNHLAKTVDKQ